MNRKSLLAAAGAAATAAVLGACAPSPAKPVPQGLAASCGITPLTHRVVQWSSDGDLRDLCTNNGDSSMVIHVSTKCGPLLATHAADDVCATWVVAKTGAVVSGPVSSMVPGDRLYHTYP